MKKHLLAIIILISFLPCLPAQTPNGDLDEIQKALLAHDISSLEKLLIDKHADLGEQDKAQLLFQALRLQNQGMAQIFIERLNDVNIENELDQNALHLSSQYALVETAHLLIEKGASLNDQDQFGYTPLNYAIKAGNQQLINFLLSQGACTFHKGYPEMWDGPHIEYRNEGPYAFYMIHDPIKGASSISAKQFDWGTKEITGWHLDNKQYHLAPIAKPISKIETIEPIFVLGDVHGQYDRLVKNLQSHQVVDANLKWNFGKGHLVFVGDIFDRGDKSTEALWLIFHLEQEAREAGGAVHLLLGNHELMVLNKDLRYLAPKYTNLSEHTGIEHSELFRANTVLGEWLRSKNAIMQINDVLFCHGGISSQVANQFESIDQLNLAISQYLNGGYSPLNEEQIDLAIGSFGPFWYRGYFMKRSKYEKIEEAELDQIMAKLNVKTMVVGHTENDVISSYFDGKVINVNIPLALPEIPEQAVWIEKGKFYHLMIDGKKQKLK